MNSYWSHLGRLPRKAVFTAAVLTSKTKIVSQWATEGVISQNWGDKLNPYLIKKLFGIECIHRSNALPTSLYPTYYFIGSHLGTACQGLNSIVWGAGFISSTTPILRAPTKIYATRGWLSQERLKHAGVPANSAVGDPALLLPLVYTPTRSIKRNKIGFIPHCFEQKEPFFTNAKEWHDTCVIDICGDIEQVIEEIVSCDAIVSSSLHGIICADAYGVPAFWVEASDKPVGDGFKFRDYFSSVGRIDKSPLRVTNETTRAEIESLFRKYDVKFDSDMLLDSCPFQRPEHSVASTKV